FLDNGRASTPISTLSLHDALPISHVIALGQRRVLLVEPKRGDHQLLVDHLSRVGDSRFKVHTATPDDLPQNKAELMGFLSNYDRSEEHTSELQSRSDLVCRLLLEK